MTYFDSSALVKRYFEEKGTGRVNELIRTSGMVVTSKLACPEIISAFSRKFKYGEISKDDFERLSRDFDADWGRFLVVEFKDELLTLIKKLLRKHPLRGADAVHLSSAVFIKHEIGSAIDFVASDVKLLAAAKAERLKTVNPLD